MKDLFRAPVCLIKTLEALAPYKGKQAKYQVRKTIMEGIAIFFCLIYRKYFFVILSISQATILI